MRGFGSSLMHSPGLYQMKSKMFCESNLVIADVYLYIRDKIYVYRRSKYLFYSSEENLILNLSAARRVSVYERSLKYEWRVSCVWSWKSLIKCRDYDCAWNKRISKTKMSVKTPYEQFWRAQVRLVLACTSKICNSIRFIDGTTVWG